jgi:runt-related transcription factor 1
MTFQAGTIGASEFHQVLQDVTNFPLKPFVLPFLKLNIPILNREMAANASMADQTTSQYLRSHQNFLSDSAKGN